MNAPCRRFRSFLDSGSTVPPKLESHAAGCTACARFAAKLEAVREGLRGHHANVAPDEGFAARVAARLQRDPANDLGRAALRLLPVTLLLLAVLAWVSFFRTDPPTQGPDADVLGWLVADSTGDEP